MSNETRSKSHSIIKSLYHSRMNWWTRLRYQSSNAYRIARSQIEKDLKGWVWFYGPYTEHILSTAMDLYMSQLWNDPSKMPHPSEEILIAGGDCHTCGAHLDSASMTSCSFTKSNIVRYVSLYIGNKLWLIIHFKSWEWNWKGCSFIWILGWYSRRWQWFYSYWTSWPSSKKIYSRS